MSSILMKGVIRNGRVEVAEPINLPDGSEVIITGHAQDKSPGPSDNNRPMTPSEIAETLAAMDKVEPFDMTDEERKFVEFGSERMKFWERGQTIAS